MFYEYTFILNKRKCPARDLEDEADTFLVKV